MAREPSVRIFPTTKTASQSGRGKLGRWLLEYNITSARIPEALMGWISSQDTSNQIRIVFDTMDQAIDFAEAKGLTYDLEEERERKLKPRNYLDNFKFREFNQTRRQKK